MEIIWFAEDIKYHDIVEDNLKAASVEDSKYMQMDCNDNPQTNWEDMTIKSKSDVLAIHSSAKMRLLLGLVYQSLWEKRLLKEDLEDLFNCASTEYQKAYRQSL